MSTQTKPGKSARLFSAATALLFLLAIFTASSCERIQSGIDSLATALPKEHVKILFVGDMSFGENYRGSPKLLKKKGYDFPLEKMAPLLHDSDFVIANLETPITDIAESPYKETKTYCHWTSVEHTPAALLRHNIKTISLANNHTLDFGVPGLKQTLDILRENGMSWFGAGMNEAEAARPFTKTFTCGKKPWKMAVIGPFEYSRGYDQKYSFYAKDNKPGAYRMSQKAIVEQIRRIKEDDPDAFVIVYPHWGKNYTWKNKRQTKNAHRFIEDGADLVIGHGGHAMQEIERHKDRWIVYGLGNFMFLSPGRYKKLKSPPFSYAAQLIVLEHKGELKKRIRLYPLYSNNKVTKYQPRPLSDEEFKEFTSLLLGKSPLSKKERKRIRRGKTDSGHFVEFRLD